MIKKLWKEFKNINTDDAVLTEDFLYERIDMVQKTFEEEVYWGRIEFTDIMAIVTVKATSEYCHSLVIEPITKDDYNYLVDIMDILYTGLNITILEPKEAKYD